MSLSSDFICKKRPYFHFCAFFSLHVGIIGFVKGDSGKQKNSLFFFFANELFRDFKEQKCIYSYLGTVVVWSQIHHVQCT